MQVGLYPNWHANHTDKIFEPVVFQAFNDIYITSSQARRMIKEKIDLEVER